MNNYMYVLVFCVYVKRARMHTTSETRLFLHIWNVDLQDSIRRDVYYIIIVMGFKYEFIFCFRTVVIFVMYLYQ